MRSSSIVRLAANDSAERVGVGVSVAMGTSPFGTDFKWSKKKHLHLEQAKGRKEEPELDLFLTAMIPCLGGVENFRKQSGAKFDCELTLLEAYNYTDEDSTGFTIATFRALAKATGLCLVESDTELKKGGWSEN